jgi:hypothetical protein
MAIDFTKYRTAFKAAAVVASFGMVVAAYFFGDIRPVVKDVCDTLLTDPVRHPGVTWTVPKPGADAGAVK